MKRVGLAAEHESPEDPAGSEIRVALTPAAVRQLSDRGHSVAVESGAGSRMGFEDDEYRAAGADMVSREELYRDRDVVIKIKGPAHAEVAGMDPGSTLVCMAHVKSIPERAAICDERHINLLALELVTERPPAGEAWVRAKLAMQRILADDGRPAGELHIAFTGFAAGAFGALQQAARSHPRSLQMLASRGTIARPTRMAERSSWTPAPWRRPPRGYPQARSSRSSRACRRAARSSPCTRRDAPVRASGSTSRCGPTRAAAPHATSG